MGCARSILNTGALQHDLKLGTQGTKLLNKGEKETVTFGPLTAPVQLNCTVAVP